jgi:O-antigen/teichoic acid export membrane protein
MASAASYGVFISWMLAMATTAAVSILIIMPLAQSGYRPVPMIKRRQVHQLLGFSLESLAASFLWALPGFVLPLIVLNMMDTNHNAYFSMAWRTSTLLTSLGSSLEMVLLAELSNDVQRVSVNTRRSLKLVLVFLLPVTLLVVVLAGKILLAFGSVYSDHATTVLRLLALGSLPATLNLLYFARKRLEKNVGEVIVFAGATSVATIALTAILISHLGIIAPAVAWLASQSVAAVLTMPRLLRTKPTVAPDQQV